SSRMIRTRLYADPQGRFIHEVVLETCHRSPQKTALVDTSCNRRFTYSQYGALIESAAHGFVAHGLQPGEVVAIFLANSWEFCVAYHAATLAGGIPTLLNPTYREREVRHQLENSGAVFLVSDGPHINGIDRSSIPKLRRTYSTRQNTAGAEPFSG